MKRISEIGLSAIENIILGEGRARARERQTANDGEDIETSREGREDESEVLPVETASIGGGKRTPCIDSTLCKTPSIHQKPHQKPSTLRVKGRRTSRGIDRGEGDAARLRRRPCPGEVHVPPGGNAPQGSEDAASVINPSSVLLCPGSRPSIVAPEDERTGSRRLLSGGLGLISGCPPKCICASDLLSCTKVGLTDVPENLPAASSSVDLSHNSIVSLRDGWLADVPRLRVLRIGRNRLRSLSPGAFRNATRLRHLDLSSNRLRTVGAELFQALLSLEELLLYNNLIANVEGAAFARLANIRKIYLSWNNLTSFAFASMRNLTHPHLRTLDLSANKFSELPVEEVSSLPAFIKNGLYLHNNPLTCNCALYALFSRWEHRGFSSVLEFAREHTCLYMGQRRAVVRILQSRGGFDNCSAGPGQPIPDPGLKVLVGKRLLVTCNTSLPRENTTFLWISPAYDFIFPPGNGNRSFRIHPNGTLEIHGAQPWNSGVYLCVAVNRGLSHNATHEVNVTVHFPKPGESFNTGLTTLLGCVVSLVLVFIYLYMTPCRCFRCCPKPPQTPSPPQEGSAQSSILCGTPPAAADGASSRKAGANSRHVVFLEPIKEGRAEKNPKILQRRTDSDSPSSVFSDCPIVQT
ncbi:PREDICTED: amphoterin-induced protein 3 [Nanorana parkeri]|uniref:amphoterin-induced protein 3 n=1 Tax=Nanorana parkeri TaxID=125878 RepID=UPI0008540EA3|nr:PREDICTED: amphoterin-induced protein 3 [Nanorana parkeri]